MKLPEKANNFVTLSLYYPQREEFENGVTRNASYKFVTRRGWISNPKKNALRRQQVRMYTEGSVFSELGNEQYGGSCRVLEKNPALGLDHDVYRYGYAFHLPIKKESQL